jgi:DNA-binding IscR family transcriptional regulator
MSIRLMSEVWRTDLPTIEKMVLLVIADHASDDGTEAWPSQATIAAKASISIRTVQRAVNSLVAAVICGCRKGAGGSAIAARIADRINTQSILKDYGATRSLLARSGATLSPTTGRLWRHLRGDFHAP